MCGQNTIGFNLDSRWFRKLCEFCYPITERSDAKPKQTQNYFRHSIENRSVLLDRSVLLENTPLVIFIETTSGTSEDLNDVISHFSRRCLCKQPVKKNGERFQ